ncbi:MAG: hypothetical protein N4A54_13930 [Peptostreptococcaceae bacterium]|jgi:hypothetical protein|nr:hypothetical protein [Peptostreptococcaceae bacterium]
MSFIRVDEILKNMNLISRNPNNDLSYKNCFIITYKESKYNEVWSKKRINKRLNFKSINGDISILFDKFGVVKHIEIDGCKKLDIKKIPQINREDLMIYMDKYYEMEKGECDYRSTYLCFPKYYLSLIFTKSKGYPMIDRNFKNKLYIFESPEGDVEISFDDKGYVESILI